MVTFLSGGTGTPKVLDGAAPVFPPGETPVVANTGDDVWLGGHLVCPDLDTVLFLDGGVLDTDTWWGIEGDTAETHTELARIAGRAGLENPVRSLPADRQTEGRPLARWRRISGLSTFMHIGDRDRALHIARTSLVDEGHTLTAATAVLGGVFGVERTLLPMSDDPVATWIVTPDGPMHFQEWWLHRDGEPPVNDVRYRGASEASATEAVQSALEDPVVIGPSNPVTSIGPMLAVEGIETALEGTPVVAVSPFVAEEPFSGPVAELMAGVGLEPSTAGLAAAYPFVDAFVLDDRDGTDLDRPTVRTDTHIDGTADAERVARACGDALAEVT
jgi:LPPG:FO 2-phospho-L-lactate transferase